MSPGTNCHENLELPWVLVPDSIVAGAGVPEALPGWLCAGHSGVPPLLDAPGTLWSATPGGLELLNDVRWKMLSSVLYKDRGKQDMLTSWSSACMFSGLGVT